ncbi:MAG: hypothetical protein DI628_08165 [Blastochloris viridis]|uniref:17 kDa surface antigen n=1 Tax=Blastochloris viridis TaxID=1079 RepID=A0A6N4R5M5_BLAVI|nr:MAG: hypothetical protein DI628_08165 [Blastochloris viridis]
MIRMSPTLASLMAALLAAGCAATGEEYASNVYTADQVNTQQDVVTVDILGVFPARVQVDNMKAKQNAQIIGGVLGALAGGITGNALDSGRGTLAGGAVGGAVGVGAGSLVSDKVLVDGVSIAYKIGKKTRNSAQVGKMCQFKPGTALLITTVTSETRIQPNAVCPDPKAKESN